MWEGRESQETVWYDLLILHMKKLQPKDEKKWTAPWYTIRRHERWIRTLVSSLLEKYSFYYFKTLTWLLWMITLTIHSDLFSEYLVSFLNFHIPFKNPSSLLVTRVLSSLFHFSEAREPPRILASAHLSLESLLSLPLTFPAAFTMADEQPIWPENPILPPVLISLQVASLSSAAVQLQSISCLYKLKWWCLMFPHLNSCFCAVRETGACIKPSFWLGCLLALQAWGPFN